jgi:Sulfotransferase family
MNQNKSPILITGSHRSGTTWVGKILAKAPNVAYVFEPFNIEIETSVNSKQFANWYQYLCEENSKEYKETLDGLMHFKYPLIKNLSHLTSVSNLARVARDQWLFLNYGLRHNRPLLKDPIAFFSTEWLAKTYGMQVLVMIRHPAAFCSSLKIANWQFDFNNFLRQPLLIERYLHPYLNEIEHYSKHTMSNIDQGILLWNCVHHTINIYKAEHPEWLFKRHEDISMNPEDEFKKIFLTLEIEFTERVAQYIGFTSGENNPTEQDAKNHFVRNSKLNTKNWLNRLTVEEIAYIKDKTSSISKIFYTEQDWRG